MGRKENFMQDKKRSAFREIWLPIIVVLLIVLAMFAPASVMGIQKSNESATLPTKPSTSVSTRECYVCGEKGASHKYGSHYYCAYCYAMVKTVHEAQ